ncbi:glycoside hydrolase family 53 protein [Pseudonocardia saturnea]
MTEVEKMSELARLAVRGADLSFTLLEEQIGNLTRDACGVAPVETILARHGANYVRLRVWVDPLEGWSDLASALLLARRAADAGMHLMINLHYSDTWADPGSQTTPAAWGSLDVQTLADTVRAYTGETVAAFAGQGTPAALVQVGNEISNGFLWPLGRVGDREPTWRNFATLLRAAVDGARSVPGSPMPRTVIHLDNGGDNAKARWFLDHLCERDVPFDVIGLSYYPFWHGSLQDLACNVEDLAVRYDADVLLVETAYPWTLAGTQEFSFCRSGSQLPDVRDYPPTPDGQARFFGALRRLVEHVPGGRGLGFCVWEPAWLPGVGWAPEAPNPFTNLTMFDHDGRALPALESLRRDGGER